MNIVLIFICCMMIAFACGFLARDVLEFGKMLIKNLRSIRLEILLNNGATTPEKQIPPSPGERLGIPGKVVDKTSDLEQPR